MEQMEQNNWQEVSWNEQIYNIIHDVLKRWHVICLIGVIVAIAADLFLTFTYEPAFLTQASVVRKHSSSKEVGEQEGTEIAEALGYILSSNMFLEKVKEELQVDTLQGTYSIEHVPGTNVMKIKAEASTPQVSYRMLHSMMERYEEVASLVVGDTKLEVIDKMQVPIEPYNQINHAKNLILFGGIGMFVMFAFYAFLSFVKDTIKQKKDVKNKLQIRLLAQVVKEPKTLLKKGKLYRKKALLVSQITTSFEFVEAFKRLRSRFEMQAQKKGYQIVSISSTMENEGKSSVIINLAMMLTKKDKKVLLIDLDLGKPALHKLMEVSVKHGVEEALRGDITLEETIYHHERTKLDCVFTKQAVSNRLELLENPILEKWLKECRKEYDYILIDTPPSHMISDSRIISQYVDAVIVVVCQNMVPTTLINRTIDHYLMQDTPVMGCVLNRSTPNWMLKKRARLDEGGANYVE
jgi:capsular exopolysaccharide synthesis family protein